MWYVYWEHLVCFTNCSRTAVSLLMTIVSVLCQCLVWLERLTPTTYLLCQDFPSASRFPGRPDVVMAGENLPPKTLSHSHYLALQGVTKTPLLTFMPIVQGRNSHPNDHKMKRHTFKGKTILWYQQPSLPKKGPSCVKCYTLIKIGRRRRVKVSDQMQKINQQSKNAEQISIRKHLRQEYFQNRSQWK